MERLKTVTAMKQTTEYSCYWLPHVSAACQTDVADGTQSVADGYVRFSSGEIIQTRTIVGKEEEALTVAWDSGDLVGIYGSAEARSLGDNYPYEVQEISEEAGACIFRYLNPGPSVPEPSPGQYLLCLLSLQRGRRDCARGPSPFRFPQNNSKARQAVRKTRPVWVS